MKIAITGANGHLGLRLIGGLNEQHPSAEVVALVRSASAAHTIESSSLRVRVVVVDYADAVGIAAAAGDCDQLVHLVGIIKETNANSFYGAHEAPCQALVNAGLGASQIISLGILGSRTDSTNACLKSRADAEQILLSGPIPATVIRVPMVLGPGDYASFALKKQATSPIAITFRSGSLEQPIYCDDVIAAILAAMLLPPKTQIIELAGPESLSRKALIHRAGKLFSNTPWVISLPIGLGLFMATVFEKLASSPPVTRAMLGVLDHDDSIDVAPGQVTLGVTLTSLDETLRAVLL